MKRDTCTVSQQAGSTPVNQFVTPRALLQHLLRLPPLLPTCHNIVTHSTAPALCQTGSPPTKPKVLYLACSAWEAIHYKAQVVLQSWFIQQQRLKQQVTHKGVWNHLSCLYQPTSIGKGLLHMQQLQQQVMQSYIAQGTKRMLEPCKRKSQSRCMCMFVSRGMFLAGCGMYCAVLRAVLTSSPDMVKCFVRPLVLSMCSVFIPCKPKKGPNSRW